MTLTKLLNINSKDVALFQDGIVRDPVVRPNGKYFILSFNFDVNGLDTHRKKYSLSKFSESFVEGEKLRLYTSNNGSALLGYQSLSNKGQVLKSVSLNDFYDFFPVVQ